MSRIQIRIIFITNRRVAPLGIELTGHDRGPSTRIFRGATVPQLIVLSCKLILHFIHIQDTKGRCPPFFASSCKASLFKWIWNIWFFLIHLLDLGVFFSDSTLCYCLDPSLYQRMNPCLEKILKHFQAWFFVTLKIQIILISDFLSIFWQWALNIIGTILVFVHVLIPSLVISQRSLNKQL